jgi:ATP synthase protein I
MTSPAPPVGPNDPPDAATVAQIRAVSRAMLFGGLWPALVVGVGAAVIAGVLAGAGGVVAALVGLVLVVGVCALGPLVMGWTAHSAPLVVMTVAMVSFVGKLGVLFVLFLVVRALDLVDTQVAAIALGATALAFIVGETVAFARAETPTIAV